MKRQDNSVFSGPMGRNGPPGFYARGGGANFKAKERAGVTAVDAGAPDDDRDDRAERPAGKFLSASGLFEAMVRDANGKRLGEIEDFILDVTDGEIEYVVFAFGGLFGLGSKLCAVAPNLLQLDEEGKCFRLSYDKERVGNAPEFDKYDWQHLPWTAHRSRIYILRGRRRKEEKKAAPQRLRGLKH